MKVGEQTRLSQAYDNRSGISINCVVLIYIFSNVESYKVAKLQVVFDKNDASFLQLKPNWDV